MPMPLVACSGEIRLESYSYPLTHTIQALDSVKVNDEVTCRVISYRYTNNGKKQYVVTCKKMLCSVPDEDLITE